MSWRAATSSALPLRLPYLVKPPTPKVRSRKHRRLQLAGIPIRFHWSAIVLYLDIGLASVRLGAGVWWAALGITMLVLAHEFGHAAFARRLGYDVHEVRLFAFFGRCRYQRPYSAYEDAAIAWGGAFGQLLVLLPAAVAVALLGATRIGALNVLLMTFTYVNAAMLVIHLIPARGLDGARAWRLPFMLLRARLTMRALRRAKVVL